HNERLTGQEGPFVTVEAGLGGPGRFHLLNGWNGLITHPPAFQQLLRRPDLDAYLVEVAGTESAEALARKLGPDRVLFIRPAGDPHLALAVAHEVLHRHPGAVDLTFVERYADGATFDAYTSLAGSDRFAPEAVATRLAPEPGYRDRLLAGIGAIASRLASPSVVPVNIPSVGLSQTKGAVAHCLWGDVLALVGKYGLRPDGSLAGGTLRLPGQINAQTEVQGLSRRVFMGRIPVTDEGAVDAARRMGLPDDAYRPLVAEPARAALDYSDPTDEPELFVCFGTQFESNMMERARWVRKLEDPRVRLVVVDPIPDPFTLARADLVIPSPPHGAAGKLYQNGEWRFTLSSPRKRSAPQTRTDATILYDAMAEVSRRLGTEPPLAAAHPDLAGLAASGYLRDRFEAPESGGGLERVDGEVSRPQLWARVLAYMTGGRGHLYCRPEHPDGRPLAWDDLLGAGSVVSGGVGTTRYRLDYDDPAHMPFGDIYRRPRRFTFFVPTEGDLALPTGIILSSGRSTMSDDRRRIRFATSTFNSGKATPATDMPEENALHVSPTLATTSGLASGNRVRVVNRATGHSIVLPVVVTDRVKGQATYVSFHKTRAELEQGRYLNTVTGHLGRCPYTAQSSFKATEIVLERVEASDTEAAGVEPQEDGK
ncbi:MAG: molybdopterin dinucleotide binding domain-containing protein, partial [Acidimicrobiales bacterium]